eukprot:TRINITY_DN51737_c0_g1_i3.p1 TRINITY_DN51737_c0_g1~~TRINITY_DN51737_c0_g1_i3.p1  ORF type:complete len:309 (+),score=53.79 TRINITY_DN51737_c0_g1_i3:254-1180(+)
MVYLHFCSAKKTLATIALADTIVKLFSTGNSNENHATRTSSSSCSGRPGENKVVVAFYILTAVFVIASILTKLSTEVHEHIVHDIEELEATNAARLLSTMMSSSRKRLTFEHLLAKKIKRFCRTLGTYFLVAVIGIIFFHTYPGEEKPLTLAIYMSVVTLSTVGFGVVTPNTEAGMMVCAYWMVIGSFCLGACVEALAEVLAVLRDSELMTQPSNLQNTEAALKSLPRDDNDRISEANFLKFALQHSGLVTKEQLAVLDEQFQELGADEEGRLPFGSLKDSLDMKSMQIRNLARSRSGSCRLSPRPAF